MFSSSQFEFTAISTTYPSYLDVKKGRKLLKRREKGLKKKKMKGTRNPMENGCYSQKYWEKRHVSPLLGLFCCFRGLTKSKILLAIEGWSIPRHFSHEKSEGRFAVFFQRILKEFRQNMDLKYTNIKLLPTVVTHLVRVPFQVWGSYMVWKSVKQSK